MDEGMVHALIVGSDDEIVMSRGVSEGLEWSTIGHHSRFAECPFYPVGSTDRRNTFCKLLAIGIASL